MMVFARARKALRRRASASWVSFDSAANSGSKAVRIKPFSTFNPIRRGPAVFESLTRPASSSLATAWRQAS